MVKKVINFKNIFIFILVMSMASLANAGSCLGGCSDDNDGGSSNGGSCVGAGCSDNDDNDGGGFSVGGTTDDFVCQDHYDPDGIHKNKVIIQKIKRSPSSSCKGDLEYKLQTAANGVVACDLSKIPSGFIVVEEKDDYSGCGYSSIIGRIADGYGKKLAIPAYNTQWQKMCSQGNDRIPEGFVVHKVSRTSKCAANSSFSGITFDISYPNGSRISVCSGPKIPNGFGFEKVFSKSWCHSNGDGGYGPGMWISKAEAGDILCEGSTLPEGMVITGTGEYSGCGYSVGIGSTRGKGFRINNPVPAGQKVCATSPIPSDYVILRDETNTNCEDNDGHYIKRSDYLSLSSNWVCVDHGTDIPSDFFITAKGFGVNGCEALTYNIRKPGSGAIVCDGSPLPDGWGAYRCGSSYSQCKYGVGGSSYGCKIKELDSGDSICEGKSDSIHKSWVISKKEEVPSSMCSSKTLVTVTEPSPNPGVKTTACYPSTVPEGFVITRDKGITSCGDSGGVEITKPYTNRDTPICAGTNVPPGYGILPTNSNNTNTTYCKNGYWNVSQIKDDGRTYHLCYMQDIPQDYVTTGISEFCDGLGYVVAPPKSPMDVCRGSPIPDGYIVSAKYSATDGPCDLEKSMQIQHPNDYGRTNICADDDGNMHIPDKYEYTQVSNPSYCNGSTGGYINPTSVVPSNRILKEPDTTANSVRPKSISCSVGTPDAPAFLDKASGGC